MDKDFAKKFDTCPNCGSTDRFCEQLSEEAREKGLVNLDWKLHMDRRDGAVFDQTRAVILPIGSKVPGYHIATDICMQCGTVYAVELARREALLRLQESKGSIPPNFNLS